MKKLASTILVALATVSFLASCSGYKIQSPEKGSWSHENQEMPKEQNM